MHDAQALIDWKTRAWQSTDMASRYQQTMHSQSGVIPLKNAVEVGLISDHARGEEILDVGAGTGRASLPLARRGCRVTAVDSAQAMLDIYRQEAGATPVRLQVMDAVRLDFPASSFDSVVALNTMVHFPHWPDVLREWARVVRPGGRLIFDICSRDHLDLARAVRAMPSSDHADNPADFFACAGDRELADAAEAAGLSVVGLIPYGLFSSGLDYNLWRRNTLASGSSWERLLSWLKTDKRLFDFALFIEREVVGSLPTVVTGRFMAVLEKAPAASDGWRARSDGVRSLWGGGYTDADWYAALPAWNAGWRTRLNDHLAHPRNRAMLYFLWTLFMDFEGAPDMTRFLDDDLARTFREWARSRLLDLATTHSLRALIQDSRFASLFEREGVNLRAGLEYELTREMLTHYFQAFPEQ